MKKFVFLSILSIFVGCSQSPTINLRTRTFGKNPKNVYWIQIPGFEFEHIAMLRFSLADSKKALAIEDVECVGSAWSYNLYDIRTNVSDSTLAQITGSQDIQNSCGGKGRFPVWQYYRSLGYQTLALESGVDKSSSLLNSSACNDNTFLEGLTLLEMTKVATKKEDNKFFHYQSQKNLEAGMVHFDQTCQGSGGGCFASLSSNVQAMLEATSAGPKGTFFMIRELNYLKFLKNGEIKKAREVLSEVNKTISYLKELENSDQDLILITGGETQSLKLPARGKEWSDFEKQGRNVKLERSRLVSPVLAKGPSAENFCGVYEESKVLLRHFWRQDESGYSLDKIIELMK
tara:strand:- start:29037 stop:30074 length:1038 start_codon:yes stop_codon:yes gene_type:complete